MLPKIYWRRKATPHRISLPPNVEIPYPKLSKAKYAADLFNLFLQDACPPTIPLAGISEVIYSVCASMSPEIFVNYVCVQLMKYIENASVAYGPVATNAIRAAELAGFLIGLACGVAGITYFMSTQLPVLITQAKTSFQAKALAYLVCQAASFSGVLHVPVLMNHFEHCFGLVAPFAVADLHQTILELIEKQTSVVSTSGIFATTLLSLLLALPRTKNLTVNKKTAYQQCLALKKIDESNLILSILDLTESVDRAFAAFLFTNICSL
eukprot:TRINITY_DN5067_c0_g1_i1.p1 TRINITY_DN5067_c0_g1~~TRINITY_DN5067_c0_g1_i1.p1  ORF type:complete len:267 (+),score=23.23 TRINITY_DN5067_c0_g1_i1:226-1026(+)